MVGEGLDFPTRFPTELLTTGWEQIGRTVGRKFQKPLFCRTKQYEDIQDAMTRNGLGNRWFNAQDKGPVDRGRFWTMMTSVLTIPNHGAPATRLGRRRAHATGICGDRGALGLARTGILGLQYAY
jgi:hypothetical protein